MKARKQAEKVAQNDDDGKYADDDGNRNDDDGEDDRRGYGVGVVGNQRRQQQKHHNQQRIGRSERDVISDGKAKRNDSGGGDDGPERGGKVADPRTLFVKFHPPVRV